jgi:hypothetical protein
MNKPLVMFFFATCLSNSASAGSSATPEAVGRGIRDVVVFAITPNADGKLIACYFDSAVDVKTGANAPDFTPSEAFVHEACNSLAHGNWKVTLDDSKSIKPVYDYCYWSDAAPDKPVCSVRLSR